MPDTGGTPGMSTLHINFGTGGIYGRVFHRIFGSSFLRVLYSVGLLWTLLTCTRSAGSCFNHYDVMSSVRYFLLLYHRSRVID